MKIRQINTTRIFESLRTGEYYIWKVNFQDGTTKNVKIKWDETSQAALEKHFGKPIEHIEYSFGIHSDADKMATADNKEYHAQQDRIEKNTPKAVWQIPQQFEESSLNEISKDLRDRYVNKSVTAHGHNRFASKQTQGKESENYAKTADKRAKGISRALSDKRLGKKEVEEAGLGGINREPSPVNVSYEDILNGVMDTWKGQTTEVNEVSKEKELAWAKGATKYRDVESDKARKAGVVDPKVADKADRRAERTMKIYNKHRTSTNEGSYEERLQEFVDEAVDMNAFADILGKQHQAAQVAKPKAKVIELDFHGWTIKYRDTKPSNWVIFDKKGNEVKNGSSPTQKDAVSDAEEFITSGGGTKQEASSNVTIDFNVDFAKEFAPEGDTFYATIDQDKGMPVLIFSTMPEKSLKKSHIRTQASKVTAGTTKLPMISMSPTESNKMGLQPNGRYILGDKIAIDDNTAMFPLIYQGTVQGKGDMMKMGKPGLTVAHPRD